MHRLKERLKELENALNGIEKTIVIFNDGKAKNVCDTQFIADNWQDIKEVRVFENADNELTKEQVTFWSLYLFHNIPENELRQKIRGCKIEQT